MVEHLVSEAMKKPAPKVEYCPVCGKRIEPEHTCDFALDPKAK